MLSLLLREYTDRPLTAHTAAFSFLNMTLELTSKQEAIVLRIAEETGKTPAQLVIETMAQLEWLDDEEERHLIETRSAEADRGEFVPADEMGTRFQQMLHRR